MSNLAKRIEKLELQIGSANRTFDVRIAVDMGQRALDLSLAATGGYEAICEGRWDDLSPDARQAWAELHAYEQADAATIAVHRERWQKAMPALVQNLTDAAEDQERDD